MHITKNPPMIVELTDEGHLQIYFCPCPDDPISTRLNIDLLITEGTIVRSSPDQLFQMLANVLARNWPETQEHKL